LAEITNLRCYKKRKERAEKSEQAQTNRAKYSRTAAAKNAEKETADRLISHVEGHRRETTPDSVED
jgi:hypothetical protein